MSFAIASLRSVGLHIRTTLIAGLLVIIPIVVTFLILKFVFDFFDPLLKDLLEQFIPHYTPGMGIISLVIIIYLAGLVTTHVLGRRMIRLVQGTVDLIPVVRPIYRAARQATEVLSSVNSNGRYTGVVLVEFPGHGLKSIGLVTGRIKDREGNFLLTVYMPTSPFPTSGFLIIMPEDRVTPTDMAVDDAMKLIISAGIVAPDKIVTAPGAFQTGPPPVGYPFVPESRTTQPHPPDNSASNQ